MPSPAKARRTQEERTAQTRQMLIEAAIAAIHQAGYNAASTALVSELAGVSRGAILHQFGTRASLMAEVVNVVFNEEMARYGKVLAVGDYGHRVYDWPKILWDVLSRPSGVAVLEILQATQSDEELAAHVQVMQGKVEQAALDAMRADLGGSEATARSVMRLMVWAVRGLTIADRVMPGGVDAMPVVELLGLLIRKASPTGRIDDIEDLMGKRLP